MHRSPTDGRRIARHEVRDITVDPKNLSKDTLPFIDPHDRRRVLDIYFNLRTAPYLIRDWIIRGIDDQRDVKCLVPIEKSIRYVARTHGGNSTVHGSCIAIYDSILHMPINQSLPLGARFSISIPTNEEDYAITVNSDKLIPVERLSDNLLPFNRRNYLLHIKPGESLTAQFCVGTAPNFSILERTHWKPLEPHGLRLGTQLNRDPIQLLQLIVGQLRTLMNANENNLFVKKVTESGLASELEAIRGETLALFDEIERLK